MGGLLKACGCYYGPASESDSRIVDRRCSEHDETRSAMELDEVALLPAAVRRGRRKMATSIKTRRPR